MAPEGNHEFTLEYTGQKQAYSNYPAWEDFQA